MENSFLKTLFEGKKKPILILIAAIALVFLFFSLFATDSENRKEKSNADAITLEQYKIELEEKIASLCSSVCGVGKCKVFITFSSGEEKVYKGGNVIETKPPTVLGVSVICRGADSEEVRYEITRMISALFNIGSNRIAVLKLNS